MRKCKKLWPVLLLMMTPILNLYASEKIGTPSLDDIEYPDDEPHSHAEVELGKKLFFDTRLSKNQTQSCATCHNPDLGFSDGVSKSMGSEGKRVGRNAPHLYNLAWSSVFFWDGRASTLEQQALGPIEAPGEMNMPLAELLPRLEAVPYYMKAFKTVYGVSSIQPQEIARAIAAFERTLISMNSPFDKYMAGDKTAMIPSAVRGMKLFQGKANCTACHDGPNFTDDSFHNIGVADKDKGRAAIINDNSLSKAFKTPGLRNIVFSAPYMHDGSEKTLEDVVRFYNRGGDKKKGIDPLIKPLSLTEQEINDLVAFMGALTDPVVVQRPELPK